MKGLRLILIAIIVSLNYSSYSYAAFPIASDTTQIQTETLEEYNLRFNKQFLQKPYDKQGNKKANFFLL